jgi:MYXO-CTERM domain-containing protein
MAVSDRPTVMQPHHRRRLIRITTALTLGLAALIAAPAPAGADCSGPRLIVDRAAAATGERIVVRGEGFGTDCNDTGRPMPPLGAPQTDIRISVTQLGVSVPVATVDASDRYEFATEATIPGSFAPGPATLEATSSGIAAPSVAIDITDAPELRRAVSSPTAPVESLDDEDDGLPWPWFAGLALLAVGGAAGFAVRRRHSVQRSA